jgi:hypothetical protein
LFVLLTSSYGSFSWFAVLLPTFYVLAGAMLSLLGCADSGFDYLCSGLFSVGRLIYSGSEATF